MNAKSKSTLGKMEKIMRVRNYSENTTKTYIHYTCKFLNNFDEDPYHISAKKAERFLLNNKYTSVSQQNQFISAVKMFFQLIQDKKLKVKVVRPRKEKKLPRIIDAETARDKILAIKNKKHKAILALGLSCGLRVSEVVGLNISDIDSKRKVIHVKNAKGRKDRIVPLSDDLLSILREYYKEYKPKQKLFNGQFKTAYSVSSCSNIVKKYLGNDKHFHLLRHSSFTSMLENGTDLRVIQVVAGHSNVQTTCGYAHVSKNFINQAVTPI